MLDGTVLFVVSGGAFDVEVITDIIDASGLVATIHVESFQHVPFIIRELILCRFEPLHVFLCLPVAFLQNVDV